MKTRLVIYGVALLLLIGLYYAARFSIERFLRGRDQDQALVAAVESLRGVRGRKVSERVIIKELPPRLVEKVRIVKVTVPAAEVTSSGGVTAIIRDTAPSVRQGQRLCDKWKRFCVDLPDGLFERRQELKATIITMKTQDGNVVTALSDFQEFSPDTHEEIPLTGLELKTEYSYVEEKRAEVPIFHLRALAGVDHRLAPGGGIEVLNLERTHLPLLENLTAGIAGYLKREKTDARVVGQLGYRLFKTNFLAHLYGGVTVPSSKAVVGAAVGVELTR